MKDREKETRHHSPLPTKINFVGFWANDHFQLTPSVGKINRESGFILSMESLKWSLEHKAFQRVAELDKDEEEDAEKGTKNTGRLQTIKGHAVLQ